jgi:hypothetical protein
VQQNKQLRSTEKQFQNKEKLKMSLKPLVLATPYSSVSLDHVKIARYLLEDNDTSGQHWVEIWVILGYLATPGDESTFIQHVHPISGDAAFGYMKFEDGFHPLNPSTALGKCDDCGTWYQQTSGDCTEQGCNGSIEPYDGYTRIMDENPRGPGGAFEKTYNAIQYFLINEAVPNPNTWVEEPIIDGMEWT